MSDPTTPDPAEPSGPPGGYGPPPGGFGPSGPYGGPAPLGWVQGPWGPRWRGPVGRTRAAGTQILLTIITCGIWQIFWSYQNHDELQRYRGDGLGGTIGLLLAIFASAAIWFTIPNEIEKMYQEEGLTSPVTTMWGLWVLLPIIGNFIWYFKVQDALNSFWMARGAPPA